MGGVAAGLAKSSGLDVTVVRICIGATVLTFGLGVPAYILMWVVLPEESPKRGRPIEPAPEQVARAIRVAIVVIAALSVLNQLADVSPFANPRADGLGLGGVLGLILLGIGVTVLFSRHRPDRTWRDPSSPPESVPTMAWRAPAPADDDYALDADEDPPTYVGPLRDAATYDPYVDDEDDAYDYGPPPRAVATVVSSGTGTSGGAALGWARVLGWFVLIWFTLASIAVTVAWLFGGISITRPAVLAVAAWLVFTAVTNTLLHAKFARAIVPTLALVLIPVAVGGATIRPLGTVGHRIVTSASVPDDETLSYRQSFGRLDLNLDGAKFDVPTTINARVGIGAVFVEVPDDAEVTVSARAGLGGYEVFGQTSDGARARDRIVSEGCEGGPKLTLNVRAGIGYIEVHRDSGRATADCVTPANVRQPAA
ncbi:MAG TPA: PspC domain-containing protein [Acidimicrobiales bacterium]|nr:PspC domain-containing protein [Acidimicrobiales bacterium]